MGRQRSPKSPGIAISEALERAARVYNRESLNATPTEVAAEAMGYQSMSGRARSALATLKMYGLLETKQRGEVAVSRDFQAYKLAPSESERQRHLSKFLRAPGIFNDIFQRYPDQLPSDGTLTHYLVVERGFGERAARDLVKVFRESVEFAGYTPGAKTKIDDPEPEGPQANGGAEANVSSGAGDLGAAPARVSGHGTLMPAGPPKAQGAPIAASDSAEYDDPIPIRLRGRRKAWLTLPRRFYDSDKETLKAQIDFLVADEEAEYYE